MRSNPGGDMEDWGGGRSAFGMFAGAAGGVDEWGGPSLAADFDAAPWNYSTPQVSLIS